MTGAAMSSESVRSRRGLLLVISSPSGAGKTSLSRRLVSESPALVLSVSATTRAAREGEVDGREYHFVQRPAFRAMVEDGAFLEWAEVHEHFYGSPREPITRHLDEGRDVLFDIDWQGARSVALAMPEDTVRVFILPPTMADLARRLHSRAQDAEDVIARRLGRARGEIAQWVDYDYVLVNDEFERAYQDLALIYRAERLRRHRNLWIQPIVETLLTEP